MRDADKYPPVFALSGSTFHSRSNRSDDGTDDEAPPPPSPQAGRSYARSQDGESLFHEDGSTECESQRQHELSQSPDERPSQRQIRNARAPSPPNFVSRRATTPLPRKTREFIDLTSPSVSPMTPTFHHSQRPSSSVRHPDTSTIHVVDSSPGTPLLCALERKAVRRDVEAAERIIFGTRFTSGQSAQDDVFSESYSRLRPSHDSRMDADDSRRSSLSNSMDDSDDDITEIEKSESGGQSSGHREVETIGHADDDEGTNTDFVVRERRR